MDLSYFEEQYEELSSPAFEDERGNHVEAIYTTKTRIKPRPQTKTLIDVERVISNKKPDAITNSFVEMYLKGIQWDWLEKYKEWEQDCEELNAWNAEFAGTVSHTESVRVVSGEGEFATVTYEDQDVLWEAKQLPDEPVRPALQTLEQWRLNNYAMLRQAAYPSVVDQLEALYDDQINGTTKFKDMIDTVKTKIPKNA